MYLISFVVFGEIVYDNVYICVECIVMLYWIVWYCWKYEFVVWCNCLGCGKIVFGD